MPVVHAPITSIATLAANNVAARAIAGDDGRTTLCACAGAQQLAVQLRAPKPHAALGCSPTKEELVVQGNMATHKSLVSTHRKLRCPEVGRMALARTYVSNAVLAAHDVGPRSSLARTLSSTPHSRCVSAATC